MNIKFLYIVGGLVAVVIITGFVAYSSMQQEKAAMEANNDAMMEKNKMVADEDKVMADEGSMDKDGAMMAKEDTMMEKGDVPKEEGMMKEEKPAQPDNDAMMMHKGSYEAYSADKVSMAAGGKVVLFFHAPWCPICRALEAEINSNPAALPDGVHILKVDYDSATELRQRYGVTVQHTFVQVDAAGNSMQKWSDSTGLGDALSRLR